MAYKARSRFLISCRKIIGTMVLLSAAPGFASGPAIATAPAITAPENGRTGLTPFQLFDLAAKAEAAGDLVFAQQALRALAGNPDIDIRSEARFRLAMLLAYRAHRPRDAASLLRQLLDERPKAARVRIELARLQAVLGNRAAAQTQLRAAEAIGLPPAVERDVRFFMQALDARRRLGASIEASFMPDTNANRATSAAAIGTGLGDVALSADARRHSGLGANLRGQAYAKLPLSRRVRWLAQLSGALTAYRASAFDDFTLAPRTGPECDIGEDRITLLAGPVWRWYGLRPYSATIQTSLTWQHPLDRRTQLRLDAGLGLIANRFDAGESGQLYSLALGVDRAVDARSGLGLQAGGYRQTASAAAYALTGGTLSAYGYREMGRMTLSANVGYGHLEADQRLGIYPGRRIDNAANATLSITFRQVRIANVSPLLRLLYEKNWSTLSLYSYARLSGEVGLSASF